MSQLEIEILKSLEKYDQGKKYKKNRKFYINLISIIIGGFFGIFITIKINHKFKLNDFILKKIKEGINIFFGRQILNFNFNALFDIKKNYHLMLIFAGLLIGIIASVIPFFIIYGIIDNLIGKELTLLSGKK